MILSGDDSLHAVYYQFQPAHQSSPEFDARFLLQLLNLSDSYSFVERRRDTDQLQQTHIRYQLHFQGSPILGSEVIVHRNPSGLIALNGHVYQVEADQPELSPQTAIAKALEAVHADTYTWQDAGQEAMLKQWTGDSLATYYPQPKLVYAPRDLVFSKPFTLCYVMDVYADQPSSAKRIYMHGSTGEIWGEEERIHIIDAEGVAQTRYSGQQRIMVDSLSPTSFRLREGTRGGGIETYNLKTATTYGGASDFTDSDNVWNTQNPDQDEVATDAHWGAEWTYDYYWNKFARNSYDGNGAKIRSYVHYGKKYNNAFWNGYVMTYGDGDSSVFTPLTSIDVCGHEISHAVTTNSAALIYKNESGALNESFSDIFGNSIEFYAKPASASWKIGEDITPNGSGIRHMHNPKAKNHPDTYKGSKWRTGTADNGGVHSNSGVQNFWYYLLCEGGSGTNDNGDSYNVDSIGLFKAEKVAYRNLTVYLTASSTYDDARFYAIRSAEDLFGSCSPEVIAVTNAWYAVGVGNAYDSSLVVADFIADTAWCHPNQPVPFINRSQNASAYLWSFGDGDTSTQVHPAHTYASYGTFSVQLIAKGCFSNTFDTLSRSNYILIDSSRDICNSVLMTAGAWDTVERCTGFIYDDGGDDLYQTQIRDTLTIVGAPCDSMELFFSTFDFENKFDSLYIYDGPNPSSPLIGGYTGNQLANGGRIVGYSGYLTLRQFADPFLTGDGFKAELHVYRKPLTGLAMPDTTVCYEQLIALQPQVFGGARKDYNYFWNTIPGDSALWVQLTQDSVVTLIVEEYCTKELLYDTVQLYVRDPLSIAQLSDTTLCFRQDETFHSGVSGGDTLNRVVRWIPLNVTGDSLLFNSDTTVHLKATVSDGCSPNNDSTEFWVTVRPALMISTSPDTVVCYRSQVNLSASGSGGLAPLNYIWSHGLGAGSNKVDFPKDDDVYRVILFDNCSGTNDTGFIAVKVLDSMRIQRGADTTVCHREGHELWVEVNGGDSTGYVYTWTPDLGNKPDPQIFPESTQTYHVSVSDGCSNQAVSDSIHIDVKAPLSVQINGPDTACFGELVFYTSVSGGGVPAQYAYRWSHAMGNLSSANTNAKVDTTISLVLEDGCSAPDTSYFKLIVRDPLTISSIADTTICSGDSIHLWSVGQGGVPQQYNYFWDKGAGIGNKVTVAPKFTTLYRVVLNDNCSSFIEDSVLVNVNATPKVNYSLDPNPQCAGVPVSFRNLTPNGNLHANFWWFGDGDTSTEFEPTHRYQDDGSYRVRLIVTSANGCSDSTEGTDLIDIVPAPKAFFVQTPEVATIADRFFNFNNQSQHASHYQWSFGDGSSDTVFSPFYTYADTGHYEVVLVARNSMGCSDEYRQIVRVKDIYLSHIPNAFTPDGDGMNDRFLPFIKGLLDYRMEIYDGWGGNIFVSEDARFGWDGKDKAGNDIPSGHYLYIITGRSVDGDLVSESGLVQVLR
ncbi:MAG: M4 family metallopeptidase [Flavobacteriales bacterium]|nr:M4 family metallopeptidase [Flavobacteriales bacterium]